MARPAKSAKTYESKNAKDDTEYRTQVEDVIRGPADNLTPPKYLTRQQKSIFAYIVKELAASGILSNLDIYVLSNCAIAVERLQYIENSVNKDLSLLHDSSYMSTRDKYAKDFYRCCNELCLSPQARAKVGSLALAAANNKPNKVMSIIGSDSA